MYLCRKLWQPDEGLELTAYSQPVNTCIYIDANGVVGSSSGYVSIEIKFWSHELVDNRYNSKPWPYREAVVLPTLHRIYLGAIVIVALKSVPSKNLDGKVAL